MTFLIVLGVLWPFVLAAGLIAVQASGVYVTDGMFFWVIFSSILGIPAVAIALHRVVPARWSEDRRYVAAGLLVLPAFAVEMFLAFLALGFGMYSLGLVAE